MSPLFSHPPPLGIGHVVPCHWLHPTQNQELPPLPCSPLPSSGCLPEGLRGLAGTGRCSSPQWGKRGCGMRQRGAGDFSVPYQQCNEDTACGNIFHWKTIPGDATSSCCQGAEHSPRAPQLGQGPRQLCWPLPGSVGQVKPGQVKPEEMLKLSHIG